MSSVYCKKGELSTVHAILDFPYIHLADVNKVEICIIFKKLRHDSSMNSKSDGEPRRIFSWQFLNSRSFIAYNI